MKLAGVDPGRIEPCSRERPDGSLLRWRFTSVWEARHAKPFLIEWADAESVPARSAPGGCKLVRLVVVTASRDEARKVESLYEFQACLASGGSAPQRAPRGKRGGRTGNQRQALDRPPGGGSVG